MIPLARHSSGKLVSPSAVERGKACDCVCLGCGKYLIAKKGEKIIHHFAHEAQTSCDGGGETIIHLKAKEFIARAETISTADISVLSRFVPDLEIPGEELPIATVESEKEIGGLIVDTLITTTAGRKVAVEIFVTHKVEGDKVQRLRRLGVEALEIELSKWYKKYRSNPMGYDFDAGRVLYKAPRQWLVHKARDKFQARERRFESGARKGHSEELELLLQKSHRTALADLTKTKRLLSYFNRDYINGFFKGGLLAAASVQIGDGSKSMLFVRPDMAESGDWMYLIFDHLMNGHERGISLNRILFLLSISWGVVADNISRDRPSPLPEEDDGTYYLKSGLAEYARRRLPKAYVCRFVDALIDLGILRRKGNAFEISQKWREKYQANRPISDEHPELLRAIRTELAELEKLVRKGRRLPDDGFENWFLRVKERPAADLRKVVRDLGTIRQLYQNAISRDPLQASDKQFRNVELYRPFFP